MTRRRFAVVWLVAVIVLLVMAGAVLADGGRERAATPVPAGFEITGTLYYIDQTWVIVSDHAMRRTPTTMIGPGVARGVEVVASGWIGVDNRWFVHDVHVATAASLVR